MKYFVGLLAATMLVTGLASASEAKTLVYCSEGSPENFNPALNTSGTSFDAARPVFNELVEFEPGTTLVRPGLAETWDISADGLQVTFHLRKGVKFHSSGAFKPTRDFDADDVLFSFNRMRNPGSPYYKVSGGTYDVFNDMDMPATLKAIDKVDDYTVKFTLTKPNAAFLADLAMDFAVIHSAQYADQMLKAGTPEQVDRSPIGTGPFSFVAYQKDLAIRYKSFPDYWRGKTKIDDLVFAITKDPTARLAKLRKNECQIMIGPNPADLATIRKNPEIKLLSQAGLNIAYLAFNQTRPPFDKREVRQALTMAIDQDAILKEVYQGAGQAAKNFIPPTIWSYNDKVEPYKYDPAKAREMLKAAGVPDGFESDLWWMPVTRPYNPNAKRIAEMMQADFERVGIKTHLVSYEWGEYRKRLKAGEYQMGQLGWTGGNGDPDNFFFLLGCDGVRPGGLNIAKWCDKDFEALLQKARSSSDQAERTRLYEQMQAIAHDEAPVFNIAHSVVYEPIRSNVVGYKVSPLGKHEFTDVDLR